MLKDLLQEISGLNISSEIKTEYGRYKVLSTRMNIRKPREMILSICGAPVIKLLNVLARKNMKMMISIRCWCGT